MVQCFYCGEKFDANSEPFEKVNSRRYAHASCYNKAYGVEDEKAKDKKALEEYIKKLFGFGAIPVKINKQIATYVHEHNYTYSGILKTLKYFYEVKHGSIELANEGIGIVPYCYSEASKYYYAIWEAQQKNENIDMKNALLPTREIHIVAPPREPMKHTRPLFTFLEDDYEQ